MKGKPVLVLDCGTTRVKGAAVDAASMRTEAIVEFPSPPPRRGPRGESEVDPRSITSAVAHVLNSLCERTGRPPVGIYLCTEMHGFLLADSARRPLTSYLGWRDARAAYQAQGPGSSMVERLDAQFGERYRAITGMRLRAGIPYANVACLRGDAALPPGSSMLFLPDWIAVSLGKWHGRAHVTMAAASGFLDLAGRAWSRDLLEAIGIRPGELALPDVQDGEQPSIGEANLRGVTVPIYIGAGDLQCAVLGAGVPAKANACVNVGTGSQVAGLDGGAKRDGAELRPFFGGKDLVARTHIPAGRMLEDFAAFFADVAQSDDGAAWFWSLLESLQTDEIYNAPLEVDPNIFPGSWRYSSGGAIRGIREGVFDARGLVASIARGWIAQYADAISELDQDRRWGTIALAGGLPRRLSWFADAMRGATGRFVVGPGAGEDTLDGLAELAFRACRKASDGVVDRNAAAS